MSLFSMVKLESPWIRICITLRDDQSWVSSTHTDWITTTCNSSPLRFHALFWAPQAPALLYTNLHSCTHMHIIKNKACYPGVIVHAFNLGTWETETGGSLSLRSLLYSKFQASSLKQQVNKTKIWRIMTHHTKPTSCHPHAPPASITPGSHLYNTVLPRTPYKWSLTMYEL